MDLRILRFDSIGSTNTEAISQAKRGAAEGLCIVSGHQTSGRGRYGRSWVSPPDAGLYFSVVLRPGFEVRHQPLLTLMAAVAVHDVFSEMGIDADIKWPNDLLVEEKKISGILAESVETETGTAVVVGIGVNRDTDALPEETKQTATSVKAETGSAGDEEDLLRRLLKYLLYHYERMDSSQGRAGLIREWTGRSSYAFGKRVRITLAGSMIEGVTEGLEPNGALRVRTDSGLRTVDAGDVAQLRA